MAPTTTVLPTTSTTTDPCQAGSDQPGSGEPEKDWVGYRNSSLPRCQQVYLIASGDSITSAHEQVAPGGKMCAFTTSDGRGLPGDNAWFSYAGRYGNTNPAVVRYYNFARTGFTTNDLIAAGPGTTDACANPWARNGSPLTQVLATIRRAKAENRKAWYVTTGGVNDTNWSTVLAEIATCHAKSYFKAVDPDARFWVSPLTPSSPPVPTDYGSQLRYLLANGGYCNVATSYLSAGLSNKVPAYNGPALYPTIAANVRTIANSALGAGVDKMVWMLYPDIRPAKVDLNQVVLGVWGYNSRGLLPSVDLLPDAIKSDADRYVQNLNATIVNALPANRKVTYAWPTVSTLGAGAADFQTSAIGGSPHPSAGGHTALAGLLGKSFAALP